MTLLARNEADIIDAHLAFHLNAGVDFVLAIDNGSDDATTEILESYARDGHVELTRDDGVLDQGKWVTGLARRAATDFGADWVINSDADEFYWPRGGTLKEVLSAVPAQYGGVRGMLRNFAPRPHGDDFFAERMTARVCNPGAEDNSPTVRASKPCIVATRTWRSSGAAIGRSAAGSTHSPAGIPSTCSTSRFAPWSNAETSSSAGMRSRRPVSARRRTTPTSVARCASFTNRTSSMMKRSHGVSRTARSQSIRDYATHCAHYAPTRRGRSRSPTMH
jgi:hypothetical protein